MFNGIEALTNKILGLALNAASLRQKAISENIANVHAHGYKPVEVDFESQLKSAREALKAHGTVDSLSIAQIQPALQFRIGASGEAGVVQLDQEMASLAENSIQYQTLLRGLAHQYSILSSAVGDGKKL